MTAPQPRLEVGQPRLEVGLPQLSVRAHAARTVPPDSVVLDGAVRATASSKTGALADAARALTALTDALAALGGVARTAGTGRVALTWSAQSTTTDEEMRDDESGRWVRTGRINATVRLEIVARDFAALPRVESALAARPEFTVEQTSWRVDDDNPAWPDVRADAIRAAVAKARDYAAALGGTVAALEHIADAGLLGGRGLATMDWMEAAGSPASHRSGGDSSPSLDPVPCELTATIDARFTAVDISLG